MKIKICGLFRPEDTEYVNQVKPDYIGFVFYEKSSRYVTAGQAKALREKLRDDIKVVGVFLNAPMEEVISLLQEGIIDMAQLHGDETEEDILYVKAVTAKPVIKAVKVRERFEAEAWLDSAADYLLFDSGAGSGKTFDWRILEGIDRDFFLAGGLRADNLPEAVKLQPFAVDLSSGVETEGVKDFAKIKAAVELIRNYENDRKG
ncbi:MAG: phosphoribosylanthranilate isomerase [Bacteroidales bacterium]|nr:phosphoribosylanthranilate isomerase [Lachnoclostridium sp.]MCM1383588.1 phosphoribosylanthranilate isomerase [Lachnoclostridium sp.]MCM1464130.1 phosphoribosylanthranilate isomerase [Bacteroidales bacterium]